MITPPSAPGSFIPKSARQEVAPVHKSKGLQRMREVFIAEDLGTVKSKIFEGVVVPSIKDFIVTLVCDTISLIFYGEKAVNAKRKITSSFISNGNRVSYSSYFASSLNGDTIGQQKLAPNMIAGYSEPIFRDFDSAKECLNDLVEILDNYPEVTVSDLYNNKYVAELDVYHDQNVYHHWGWKNLGNAHVTAVPNGWTMNLPRPKPLDDH